MSKKPIDRLHPYRPIPREPWIEIPSARELRDWTRDDEIAFNQTKRFMKVADLYTDAFDFLKTNGITGDYFEFGCHKARTFRLALTEARRQNIGNMRFLAFDSFDGFPEAPSGSHVDQWRRGALRTSEEAFRDIIVKHGLFVPAVETIKGNYAESLTTDLSDRLLAQGRKAAMITVDCDLYESARAVFRFIGPFLQEGTLIYIRGTFSGYKGSPRRTVSGAFEECRAKLGFEFADFNDLGWLGRSYVTFK